MSGGWKNKRCADLTPQEWEKKRAYERRRWHQWSEKKRKQHSAKYVVWYWQNHEKAVEQSYTRMLKHRYYMSRKEYDEACRKQGDRCAVCSNIPLAKKKRGLRVDHNHTTKKFRALLCQRCNTLVGYLEINPGLVKLAQAYLSKFSE